MEVLDTIKGILEAGIPVMGHLGLTPQSINKFGTYAVRAVETEEAEKLVSDAQLLDQAGCFGIVLEKVPAELAARVTSLVKCPTIGIGAGAGTDGQVLVVDDMLGKPTDRCSWSTICWARRRASRPSSCAGMPTSTRL